MYELSYERSLHSRDIRCLDYQKGVLVTGGSDKIVNMFSVKNGQLEKITTLDIFEKGILSVKINRKGGAIFAAVGTVDGKIFGIDQLGTPLSMIEYNSPICSIDFIDADHIVTGSWDGKGVVWEFSTSKKISEYVNHKHAVTVFYNSSSDFIVSGSQDKALNLWKWKDGSLIKRIESAHNDIIRQISQVEEVGFMTCSNDETLKLWTFDLQLVQTLTGHTGFVFSVKSKQLGTYYSGGEDKALKIWNNEDCSQTIQLPSQIWSVVLDQNNDLYTACSDGFLRVFTMDPARRAQANILQAFQKQTLEAASKKSGISAQEIQKLPTIAQMSSFAGKKEGEIRMFKNGAIPEAFMWQNGKWDKIGEVITQGGQQSQGGTISQPKYYPGDKYFEAGQYDYLFDVDDDSGARKVIPYNDGGNALEAAEKYLMREGMSKNYLEQIRKFLMDNSSRVPRKAIKQSKKEISFENMNSTPSCSAIQYSNVKNPSALFKKITQFNGQVQGQQKLLDKELTHCERIVTLLQNSKNYHSWKLDFKELDALKKLLTWPKHLKFPVWDLLRAFLIHYQSQTLFSGLDAGLDIIIGLVTGLETENSEAIYSLIFKTLANVNIQNTNKNGMIKHAAIIFGAISNFSKRKELMNKNLLAAVAGFIYNYSITIYEKNLENQKIIGDFAQILKMRIQMDDNEDNRSLLLQAAANVMFKHRDSQKQFQFLRPYLLGNEVSKDLELLLG